FRLFIMGKLEGRTTVANSCRSAGLPPCPPVVVPMCCIRVRVSRKIVGVCRPLLELARDGRWPDILQSEVELVAGHWVALLHGAILRPDPGIHGVLPRRTPARPRVASGPSSGRREQEWGLGSIPRQRIRHHTAAASTSLAPSPPPFALFRTWPTAPPRHRP